MKKIIISLFIILALFLVGCNTDLSQVDLSKIDPSKAITCDKPYIKHGYECCLDNNDNKICDDDEVEQEEVEEEEEMEETCSDECSSDSCKGEEYVACLKQSDGCKDKVNKGKVDGKCGFSLCSDECSSDRCSDQTFVSCEMQDDGCKDEEWVGFVKGKCGVECTYESDCNVDENCYNLECVKVVEEEPACYDECNLDLLESTEGLTCQNNVIYTCEQVGECTKLVYRVGCSDTAHCVITPNGHLGYTTYSCEFNIDEGEVEEEVVEETVE